MQDTNYYNSWLTEINGQQYDDTLIREWFEIKLFEFILIQNTQWIAEDQSQISLFSLAYILAQSSKMALYKLEPLLEMLIGHSLPNSSSMHKSDHWQLWLEVSQGTMYSGNKINNLNTWSLIL